MSKNNESGLQEQKEVRGGGRSILLGVFTIVGVFIIAVTVGVLPSYFGLRKIKPLCANAPLTFNYDENKEDYLKAKKDILHFVANADKQERQEFTLTVKQLNALIAHEEKLSFLKGLIYFKNTDKSEFVADVSFPMHKNPRFSTDEKLYLNGRAQFEATFKKKKFWIRFAGIWVKDQLVELDIINGQSERNMLEFLVLDPYFKQNFSAELQNFYKIKNIIVEKDKVTFTNWRQEQDEAKTY